MKIVSERELNFQSPTEVRQIRLDLNFGFLISGFLPPQVYQSREDLLERFHVYEM